MPSPRKGGTQYSNYLNAANGDELETILDEIGSILSVSCAFNVRFEAPESVNLDFVNVSIDDETVPYDGDCKQNSGWQWSDASRSGIALCTSSCNTLRAFGSSRISGEIACREENRPPQGPRQLHTDRRPPNLDARRARLATVPAPLQRGNRQKRRSAANQ